MDRMREFVEMRFSCEGDSPSMQGAIGALTQAESRRRGTPPFRSEWSRDPEFLQYRSCMWYSQAVIEPSLQIRLKSRSRPRGARRPR